VTIGRHELYRDGNKGGITAFGGEIGDSSESQVYGELTIAWSLASNAGTILVAGEAELLHLPPVSTRRR
jgi:hypothetical protein